MLVFSPDRQKAPVPACLCMNDVAVSEFPPMRSSHCRISSSNKSWPASWFHGEKGHFPRVGRNPQHRWWTCSIISESVQRITYGALPLNHKQVSNKWRRNCRLTARNRDSYQSHNLGDRRRPWWKVDTKIIKEKWGATNPAENVELLQMTWVFFLLARLFQYQISLTLLIAMHWGFGKNTPLFNYSAICRVKFESHNKLISNLLLKLRLIMSKLSI